MPSWGGPASGEPRQEILRRYYDEAGGTGFDYAYRFPGMNKVLQAAGRVIRTQEDRGVVLLLDDRFARAEYTRLFPATGTSSNTCAAPQSWSSSLPPSGR